MSFNDILVGIFTTAFVASVIRISTPLILPALGGLISDLAGSINIALEGMMLIAAFSGVVVSAYTHNAWLGMIAGILAATASAYILAVFHLEFGGDIILAGIALNILAAGGTVFVMYTLTGDKGSTSQLASLTLPSFGIPIIRDIPILGEVLTGYNGENMLGYHLMTYVAFIAAFLIWILLYRVPLGAHLRAVGENAQAAASVGINVKRVRYIAILFSGLLAAFGGINLSMGYLTLFQSNMTNGRGFIALAAIYLGNRSPIGTVLACLIFGLSDALANQFGSLGLPPQWMTMVPPAVTIISLMVYNVRRKALAAARAREFQARMAEANAQTS